MGSRGLPWVHHGVTTGSHRGIPRHPAGVPMGIPWILVGYRGMSCVGLPTINPTGFHGSSRETSLRGTSSGSFHGSSPWGPTIC